MIHWRLGTIGFGYRDWAGVFYPKPLRSNQYLAYYAKLFDAVELDTTFHATPSIDRVKAWADQVPEGFRFCAKAPKLVTHETRVDLAVGSMLEFLHVLRAMGPKLAAVLIQFPPTFSPRDMPRLERFLRALPKNVRYAIEFRHDGWWNEQTECLLRERDCCWVAADYADEPAVIRPTTDFLYVRLIGRHRRFKVHNQIQSDVRPHLAWWKQQIEAHMQSGEAYVLFNNDYAGYAIGTCRQFAEMVGITHEPMPAPKGGLFHQ